MTLYYLPVAIVKNCYKLGVLKQHVCHVAIPDAGSGEVSLGQKAPVAVLGENPFLVPSSFWWHVALLTCGHLAPSSAVESCYLLFTVYANLLSPFYKAICDCI